jgi:hypothetical protein
MRERFPQHVAETPFTVPAVVSPSGGGLKTARQRRSATAQF